MAPRDGSNIYSQPFPDVVEDTTIESTVYNGFTNDVAQDLNAPRPIVAGGTGATSADQALFNLAAEKAAQLVTNYDSHLWIPGSFRSAAAATGAPNGTAAFAGVVYINEALANPPTNSNVIVEARDLTSGTRYTRRKAAGIWGAWITQAGSTTELDAAYVNVAGDTMSGDLQITKADPILTLQKTFSGQACLLGGNTGANARWRIVLGDNTAEASLNTGSHFGISRYADAGTFIDTPFAINRTDGAVFIVAPLKLNSVAGVTASQIIGMKANSYRWSMSLGESDANAGFSVSRYDDAGVFIDAPLAISRQNAGAFFTGTLSSGAISSSGQITGKVAVNATATSANASFIMNNSGGTPQAYVYWNASDTNLWLQAGVTQAIVVNSATGRTKLAGGLMGKSGLSGAYSTIAHNFVWVGGKLQAWVDDSNIGDVTVTSDYRTKKDVIDLPGMWDTVKAMRPIKYTQAQYTPQIEIERRLKEEIAEKQRIDEAKATGADPKPADPSAGPMFAADDIERWGFVAHELQDALLPTAATGIKDQADAVQSLNLAPVVAALTKALQEAMARIEALEAA